MNSMTANPGTLTSRIARTNSRRAQAVCLFSIAALLIAPGLHAQSDAPKPTPTREAQPSAARVYSMKFKGWDMQVLAETLKAAFPKDNVVIAPSARDMRLDPFEIRDVTLKELGRTIEFLSDGVLTVEVVEDEQATRGNIWRIGTKQAAGASGAVAVKMRSIAAPHLFHDENKLDRLVQDVEKLEQLRISTMRRTASVKGGDLSGAAVTQIVPLPEQNVFVLMGSEDGIAGVESFVRAAEQLAADVAAEKRAEEKAQEDAARKEKEAARQALEAARATRDGLAEQLEASREGIERKERMMAERMQKLKTDLAEKRRALESKLNDEKGLSAENRAQARAELDAHIRNAERILAEEDARSHAQMEQLSNALIDLQAKLRAAELKLKK